MAEHGNGAAEDMAVTEQRAVLDEAPEAALAVCDRALATAGFKNITSDPSSMLVTAEKRASGQYTHAPISVFVSPSPDGTGSEIIVRSQAGAQSLSSMASRPSKKLVKQFLEALGQDDPVEPPWYLKAHEQDPVEAPPLPPTPAATTAPDSIEKIERLHHLLTSGALTQEEFDSQKAKILDESS